MKVLTWALSQVKPCLNWQKLLRRTNQDIYLTWDQGQAAVSAGLSREDVMQLRLTPEEKRDLVALCA